MKIIISIVILALSNVLSAQVDLKTLIGNWKIKSFTQNGNAVNTNNIHYIFSLSDVGDYLLEQVFTEKNKTKCTCTAMLSAADNIKVYNDFIMCSDEENPNCTFWIAGEYAYELKNGILYISNEQDKMELQRK